MAVSALQSDLLTSRVVINTNNYYPERDGQIAELDIETTTMADFADRHFDGAALVKAFNHIPTLEIGEHAQVASTLDRRALTDYGNDAAAVSRVSTLNDQIGFDAVNGGHLAESWRIQRDTASYGPRFTAAELTEKLAAVRRYRDLQPERGESAPAPAPVPSPSP
ncbi:MAG: NADPH-dependent F420 reductase [Microbacteriaceae bacterium]